MRSFFMEVKGDMKVFENRGQLVATGQSDLLKALGVFMGYEHPTDTTDAECERVMKEKPEVGHDD